jgi:hypothetical protein
MTPGSVEEAGWNLLAAQSFHITIYRAEVFTSLLPTADKEGYWSEVPSGHK